MHIILTAILILLAYLLGSVCTAIFVCKLFKLPDPRTVGSNNPGATNVMRIGGKVPALLTFLGDGLKGAIPTFVALYLGLGLFEVQLVMLGAILGHIFPVFFHFKGGKAVATTIGSLIAFNYLIAAAFVGVWLITFLLTRVSALGALLGAVALPVASYLVYNDVITTIPLLCITLIILSSHHSNIRRLIGGKERKI